MRWSGNAVVVADFMLPRTAIDRIRPHLTAFDRVANWCRGREDRSIDETVFELTSTHMKRRILVLPLAAVLISSVSAWKLAQPPQPRPKIDFYGRTNSPRFELLDQRGKVVKFERYLSRHRIIVVFYDGEAGPDQDPRLVQLRAGFDKLQRRGDIVVAISGSTPHKNRQADEFPFPLLTDINPQLAGSQYMVHKQWGSYDSVRNKPLYQMFVVNRAGLVKIDKSGQLLAESDPTESIARLIQGKYYDR